MIDEKVIREMIADMEKDDGPLTEDEKVRCVAIALSDAEDAANEACCDFFADNDPEDTPEWEAI